jgi:hypothetical protein
MTDRSPPPSDQDGFFWKTKTLEEMSNAEWESLWRLRAATQLEDEVRQDLYPFLQVPESAAPAKIMQTGPPGSQAVTFTKPCPP